MKSLKYFFVASILSSIFLGNTSCGDDPIPNPEELITTLRYTLAPQGGGKTVVLNFKDPDGVGGIAPVISSDKLKANTIYDGTLLLLDESVNPIDSIIKEIQNENQTHQFFFQKKSGNLDLNIIYNDLDASNLYPIGIKTILTTGIISQGILRITLRHQPNKSATGAKEGDITNAGGETDIEVDFNVSIE